MMPLLPPLFSPGGRPAPAGGRRRPARTPPLPEQQRRRTAGCGPTIAQAGVVSDGPQPIQAAVAAVLPDVPHQLCQVHYLREAAKPIFEADRHAKTELKKQVRGVRPLERALDGRDDDEATAIRGYCLAVRSALTDDGQPPLSASGVKLHDRVEAIAASIARVEAEKGGSRSPSPICSSS